MANREDFPQPGSYTHFHWISEGAGDEDSADPRVSDPDFEPNCNESGAGGLVPNTNCFGWFIEISAVREFAFEHGNEIILVRPGLDNATHMNLVSDYEHYDEGTITPTR